MDNTPTAEADSLNVRMRPSPMAGFLFANAVSTMYGSISRAASSCTTAGSGKHRFGGYPRRKAKCVWCGTPLFREVSTQ